MNPIILTVWFGTDPAWEPIARRWLAHTRTLLPARPIVVASDRFRDVPAGVECMVFETPLLPFRPGANGRGLLFDRKGWLVGQALGLLAARGQRALYLDHDAELQRDPFPELLAGPWAEAPLALPPDAGPIALPIVPPATMRCAGVMWFGRPDTLSPVRNTFAEAFADLGPGMEFHILREQAAWSVTAYRLSGCAAQLPVAFNWIPMLYGPAHGRAVVEHWHSDGKFHRRAAPAPVMTIPA